MRPTGSSTARIAFIAISLAAALVGCSKKPNIILITLDTFRADEACIEKFGPAYADYMQRVPRVNFVAGMVRLWRRRGSRSPAS